MLFAWMLMADPPAEVVAADAEHDGRQQVEAEEAPEAA